MDELHKLAIHRRGFLNGLIGGLAGGSLIAAGESLVTGASAGTRPTMKSASLVTA